MPHRASRRPQMATWALLTLYVVHVYLSRHADGVSPRAAAAAEQLSGDPSAPMARTAAAALEADGFNSQRLPPLPTTWGPGYAKIEAAMKKAQGGRGAAPAAAAPAVTPAVPAAAAAATPAVPAAPAAATPAVPAAAAAAATVAAPAALAAATVAAPAAPAAATLAAAVAPPAAAPASTPVAEKPPLAVATPATAGDAPAADAKPVDAAAEAPKTEGGAAAAAGGADTGQKPTKPKKAPAPQGQDVPVVPHPMNRALEELQVPANTGVLAADDVKGYYRKLAKAYLLPFVGGIKRGKFFDILRRRTYGLTPPGGNKGAQTMLVQIVDQRVYLLDPYEVPKNSKPFYRSRINEIIWLLSRLALHGRVPDTEFLVAIHDCVQTTAQPHTYRGATYTESNPVFTIVSCNFSDNVPFPMWEGGDTGDRGAGFKSWDAMMKEYAQDTTPWEQKTPKAVFRGGNRPSMFYADKKDAEAGCGRTGRSRLKFLADQSPSLYDVSISGQCGGKSWELQRLGVKEHHRFKYILYAEGNCFWADRLNKQIFGPSVIVKQETPCGQFWEPLLRPMVHYLPTDFFFDNTDAQLRWAIEHDAEAKALVTNANEFANNFLTLAGIEAYTEVLLAEYTALLEKKDIVRERGATEVTHVKL